VTRAYGAAVKILSARHPGVLIRYLSHGAAVARAEAEDDETAV